MRLRELQEGMGASAGGGTPGAAGAGGSSLGLPYPSTYEEENDKFKYRGPQKTVAMTTEEEQGEFFNDHQKMQEMMDEKNWPTDLQIEVLQKYSSNTNQGEDFILDHSYKGIRRLNNYGLLQNTENLQILTKLPQDVIDKINQTWQMSIPKLQASSVSDLAFEKYINQFGFLTKPAVAIDADIVMAEARWVASIIKGEKAKACHILTPKGPGVKSNELDPSLSPAKQKELAFVEDKHWPRSELPQLNINDLKDEDIEEKHVRFEILKPVQTEREKGLVKKTLKMLKKGKHKPIVIDQLGYIVNGHHRYDAYKKLGATYVPVIKVNATIEELIDKYM